jgi:hypothetical protein
MGAGIYAEGSLVVRRCEFAGNDGGSGGAILVLGPWKPLIVDCVMRENTAVGLGGGFTASGGTLPIIRDCRIWGNSAGDGGGICLTFAGGWIEDCEIWDNKAAFGGGIDLLSATGVKVSRLTIRANEASFFGGGVYASSTSAILDGCTIQGNHALGDGGAGWLLESDVAFERCALRDNSSAGTVGGVYVARSLARLSHGELAGNGLALFVEGQPAQPVEARFNWWGDASGPYHPVLNPTGLGDEVGDHVDFVPWNGTSSVPEACVPRIRLRAPSLYSGSLPIVFTLPARSRVDLAVFDAQGRLLAKLLEGEGGPGITRVCWDGHETRGAWDGTGVCFVRLSANGEALTRRVVCVR